MVEGDSGDTGIPYRLKPDGRLSAEGFALAWNMSVSIDEVAVRTGKTRNGCRTTAAKLRARGMNLKFFRRSAGAVELDSLRKQLTDLRRLKDLQSEVLALREEVDRAAGQDKIGETVRRI